MTIQLYDLAASDEACRFSPNCWRIRMALAHKDLEVETIPWRFTEKEAISRSGQKLVPVLIDGDDCVHDSWIIACHLDAKYPDSPPLFTSDHDKGLCFFMKNWVERSLFPHFIKILAKDIHDLLHEKDKNYFRETREKRFNATLEEFTKNKDQAVKDLSVALTPARATLETQIFIGGSTPSYADYILFAAFQWARCVSPTKLLEKNDPIFQWRERLLDMYGGLARNETIGYDV